MAAAVTTSVEPGLDPSGTEGDGRENNTEEESSQPAAPGPTSRLAKLPLSRIKALMKADPDVSLASQESVFIIAKATVRVRVGSPRWGWRGALKA